MPGRPGGTFRLGIVEPTAIDPYNSQETEGILVTKALFTGLVSVRPNGDVYDGVASAWTPNADCSQWTFTLKPGTTFSNGEPVDSAAFKRGWERTAAQDSASAVAYHLNEVAGFDADAGRQRDDAVRRRRHRPEHAARSRSRRRTASSTCAPLPRR